MQAAMLPSQRCHLFVFNTEPLHLNIPEHYRFDSLAYQSSAPELCARFKTNLDDFIVDEIMPITPSGEGEHIWLKVRKTGSNTEYVARQLAAYAGVKPMAVSYAGLKDRHGITSQWFSVHMPGQVGPDWSRLSHPEFEIIEQQRHNRKLKRGALSGNHFVIRLRDIQDPEDLWVSRTEHIQTHGVPNYFGPQRFGHGMQNLTRAEDLFKTGKIRRLKPHQRSIHLSAARSWLFNCMISERITTGCYDQPVAGDVFMKADSNACFVSDIDDEITQRLQQHNIHLTAALWGEGESMASHDCLAIEKDVAAHYPLLASGLEAARLKQERRAIRLMPLNWQYSFEPDHSILLAFDLPAGTFATSVLRELCQTEDLSS